MAYSVTWTILFKIPFLDICRYVSIFKNMSPAAWVMHRTRDFLHVISIRMIILHDIPVRVQNTFHYLRWSILRLWSKATIINYFRKTFPLRCLVKFFWIRLWLKFTKMVSFSGLLSLTICANRRYGDLYTHSPQELFSRTEESLQLLYKHFHSVQTFWKRAKMKSLKTIPPTSSPISLT